MVTYPKDWEENIVENIADITTGCRDTEDEWKERHLSEIFDTVTDYVAAGSFADIAENVKYLNQGYAQLVRTVDLKNKFTSKDQVYVDEKAFNYLWRVCLDQEGIILPNVGNCGEVYYFTPEDFPHKHNVLAPNAILVRSSKYNNRFMAYRMMSDDFQEKLRIIISPSGQTKFNKTEFKKLTITIPSVEEQNEIANTLSAFDTYIDDLDELIEKKKAIRDGALEDLMSGRTRLDGYNETWTEHMLSDVCKVYDGTHQTPKYTSHGVRFVSVENIKNIYGSNKFISQLAYERDFKIHPEKGDILMTRIGDIGTACIIKNDGPLAYYVSLALLKYISIDSGYLQYYIGSHAFQHELDDRTLHHATPKKINKGEIGKCKIMFPINIKEQQAIASVLTSMDEEIESLEAERDKMVQIREGAMDDLLTGRVRLSV